MSKAWIRGFGVALVMLCVSWWGCEPRPGTSDGEVARDGVAGQETTSGETPKDDGDGSPGEVGGPDNIKAETPPEPRQEPASEPSADADGGPGPETQPDAAQCQIPSQVGVDGAIRTERGWVAGVKEGSLWAYKGIPYAAPPVGALRWRPTEAHQCWQDIRDAKAFGDACLQYDTDSKSLVGKEDCLTLNVWRPASASPTSPKAVVVFIHGGGNVQGSSGQLLPGGKAIYNGANIATRGDVVVVSFNYRLGVLGFLALAALSLESAGKRSGNYGILDQVFALGWIQRNIKAFGGDPSRVMIFGESAGAVNTCVHVASPLSKGLFHRALMQSGTCLPSTPLLTAEAAGAQRLQRSSCKDAQDAAVCLRGLDARKLSEEFPGRVNVGNFGADALEAYGPVVDGWVLKQSPIQTIAAGAHNDVPFVIGSNLDEMDNLLVTPVPTANAYESLVRSILKGVKTEDIDALLKLYDVTKYASPRLAMVDLLTDASFTCNAMAAAAAAASTASKPHVWRYFFQRRATTPRGEIPARHGIELLYVFHTLTDVPLYNPAKEDLALAEAMIDYWTQFAKAGTPNGVAGRVAWDAYYPAKDNTLLFDEPIKMQQGVRNDRCALWAKITASLRP